MIPMLNEVSHWTEARDLYRACLDLDPEYAPAWARLARCERLIGKYSSSTEEAQASLARADACFQRALALNPDLSISHSLYAQYMQGLALASLGRDREAIAALRWRERETTESRIRPYLTSLRALLEGDRVKSLAALEVAAAIQIDSEAVFYLARTFARLGAHDRAAVELRRVIDGGFWCYDTFMRDPWLNPVRSRPDVRQLLEQARHRVEEAQAIFVQGQGPEVLAPLAR